MKLRYGNNAAGKSRYSIEAGRRGNLVLTSDMFSWKDGKKFSQFTAERKESNKILSDIKTEILSATFKNTLGYEGKNMTFRAILAKTETFNDMFISIDLLDSIETIGELIEMGTISDDLLNVSIIDNLGNEVRSLTTDAFSEIVGLTKFYASVKVAIKTGDEQYISELVSIKTLADEALVRIQPDELRNLVKKGDIKSLNILRTIENPGQTIVDELVSTTLKNIKLLKGASIRNELLKLQKYDTDAVIFSLSDERKVQLEVEYGIELIISDDSKTFEYVGELSNGQFTMVATNIVIDSVPNNKIMILDDVLETLDDGNSYELVDNLINKPNIEILTHSSSVAALIDKVEDETGVSVESRDFNNNKIVYSWRKLLQNVRSSHRMSDSNLFVRSIIKIISRYIAKDGAIYSEPGHSSAQEIKESYPWKHWMLAGKLFHYHPLLQKSVLATFFPWLEDEDGTLTSIEFVNIIIEKLNIIQETESEIHGLSIRKIIILFTNVLSEITIEMNLFNEREANSSDALQHFWGEPSRANVIYNNSRIENGLPKRKNKLIHQIDMSPLPLV